VVRLKQHTGLAGAFQAGIDTAIDLGADIIVNTDGDNQYPSQSIPALVAPIVTGRADIAIGDRQTDTIAEFSGLKKFLQRRGSSLVRRLSGAKGANDVVSGFRAFSRYAASRIFLNTRYSYTIESIMQASKRGLRIQSVPIRTNAKTRPSRLYRHMIGFLSRSGMTILRSYTLNDPLVPFLAVGLTGVASGLALGVRYLVLLGTGEAGAHVQSLILAAILIVGGITVAMAGVLAELVVANRRMIEELLWREKVSRRGLIEQKFGRITAPVPGEIVLPGAGLAAGGTLIAAGGAGTAPDRTTAVIDAA
jgi:hypothetical protein